MAMTDPDVRMLPLMILLMQGPLDANVEILSIAEVWLPPSPPSYKIVAEAREAKSPADLERSFRKGCVAVQAALALVEVVRSNPKIDRQGD